VDIMHIYYLNDTAGCTCSNRQVSSSLICSYFRYEMFVGVCLFVYYSVGAKEYVFIMVRADLFSF